nr:reverse transcriptase domain-containing protein [Tanacetum cinerariifolium]
FPADFVVVDFEPDPRVPLILERCFLKTNRAQIDVHKGELTLRIRKEAITYNLDQTVRYSANYDQMTANKIDVICEIYSQEILSFSDVTASGSPTPDDDPIVSTTSPTLTPFGDSDFLLFEEADAFLGLEDDPDSPKINPFYYDPEGDILLLEAILNSEPSHPLPNHEQYFPSYKKELKVCEAKTVKSSVDEPPEVELKDLPPHLEYAFLEGDNKLPVIIAKELGDEEKSALIKVLNPVHCVPKKGGFTVVENEENELILTRLVTGWRLCIDYRKLNEATRKDHFPLSFMDQMLERLAGNEYYFFLDGFSGYFQIPIDPRDQEKTTFTCPYGTFAYRRMPFGLYNASGTFQRCMLAIFHDMVEKTMEVFMDNFLEKSHFMVKEGIVLHHKISKNGIEVDKAKIDVIAKLPHPTTVKDFANYYAGNFIVKVPRGLQTLQITMRVTSSSRGSKTTASSILRARSLPVLPGSVPDPEDEADCIVSFDIAFEVHLRHSLCLRNGSLAYENSLIYKERTKKLYDDKIKNRIFIVGDQVLLFNSRLKIFSGLMVRGEAKTTSKRILSIRTTDC